MPLSHDVPVLIAVQRLPSAVQTPHGNVASISGRRPFQPWRRGTARTTTTSRLHGLAGQTATLPVADAEKHGSARTFPHTQRQTNGRPSISQPSSQRPVTRAVTLNRGAILPCSNAT